MSLLHLARYRDIAAEVAGRLISNDGIEVLVASGGVANAIAAELLRRRPGGFAGLRIETIETFAARVVNAAGEFPRAASNVERRLAMRMAVRSIDDPMMESRGIAAMIDRSWRDVRDGGATLAEFESRARNARLRNASRTKLLVRAWREYERLMTEVHAIDPADLLRRAAAIIESGRVAIAPHIVAGFYDMTGAQRRVVEALRAIEKVEAVYVPAAEGEAYRFAEPFVASFGEQTNNPAPKQPQWDVAQYEARTIELRETCRAAGELLKSGVDARDIGIVARTLDPYDIALLNRFAAAEGFAISTVDETPLVAHRLGRAVATLLRLRENGFPRSDVIELLRGGFVSKRALNIDEIDMATRRYGIAGGTSEELRAISRYAAVDAYVAALAEIEPLAPEATLSAIEAADFLANALISFAIETDLDLVAAEAIDDIAAAFRRTSPWNVRFDAATIIDALQNDTIRQPAPDTRQTVFVSDVMRFRGRSFAHLFAVRMQDDVFPQRRLDDPLLPDYDRQRLDVREIGDGRDEERMLFQLLLDGAETVHFSFAGGDGFGKTLRPSPLLKSFVIAQQPERKTELLKNFGASFVRNAGVPPAGLAASRRQLQLLAKMGTKSVFDGYLFAEDDDDTLRAKLADAITSVSPTQLEDFGECPQKFFFKHILGVRDVDDPEHELQLNARDKGKLDHGILERLYRSLNDDDYARAAAALPQLDEAIGSRVDALVDDAFAALASNIPPFNPTMRAIERTATKRILREFVAHDLADLESNGFRPKHFEYRFGKTRHSAVPDHLEPFVMAVADGVDLRVDGTIDRIDAGADGYRIIDYKGGKATRHKDLGKKIDRGVRLQLALYAMAVSQFFDADAAKVRGAIKPLVTSDTNATKFAFELAEKETELRETLNLFVSSIIDGVFPAFPADDDADFNACKYCPVNHSCRTKHDFAEKYLITRHNEPRTLLGGGAD
ncbi:MAG: PD-(D/E)XK nuclease family protein [Acidobacteria bacterium]|nr:PD-(D/E)XK nuclease family protein [Acidobacteriota bacterium]MBV9187032.1 PD-(D/E)XK nuclease family protein [Acidobacteriota bacterium]